MTTPQLPPEHAQPIIKAPSPEQYPTLDDWFEGGRESEASFAIYAFDLVEKRFQAAGLVARLPDPSFRRFCVEWSHFTWHLFYALWGPIEAGDKDELVKAVFADLADYCLLTQPSDPAWRFAVLVNEFWTKRLLNERVIGLLPKVVMAAWPQMETVFAAWLEREAEREEELFRLGQMGY